MSFHKPESYDKILILTYDQIDEPNVDLRGCSAVIATIPKETTVLNPTPEDKPAPDTVVLSGFIKVWPTEDANGNPASGTSQGTGKIWLTNPTVRVFWAEQHRDKLMSEWIEANIPDEIDEKTKRSVQPPGIVVL